MERGSVAFANEGQHQDVAEGVHVGRTHSVITPVDLRTGPRLLPRLLEARREHTAEVKGPCATRYLARTRARTVP